MLTQIISGCQAGADISRYLIRLLFLVAVYITCSISLCYADKSSGPWKISVGDEHVTAFKTDFIPETAFYPSFAIPEKPDEVLVFPGLLEPLTSSTMWMPEGMPFGLYAFLLNIASDEISLMPMNQFSTLGVVKEDFRRQFGPKFKGINFAGKDVGMAAVYKRNGRELIAVGSAISKTKKRTSFGIPSLMPFMGRQKFFETATYYDGTLYLEVFDTAEPQEPIVQLQKKFKNFLASPVYGLSPEWVQGAKQPLLVFVGKSSEIKKGGHTIFLLNCQTD